MAEFTRSIKIRGWLRKALATFVIAISLFSLVTCHRWYMGDGHLVDRGWISTEPRYTLKLGEVDLSKRNSYTYTMKYLPSSNLTVGFHITAHNQQTKTHIGESHSLNPRIRLFLRNERGNRVIDEAGNLKNEWVWSYTYGVPEETFVFRGGKVGPKIDLGEGVFRQDHIGVLADQGWGTYFTPQFWDEYDLVLEVLEEDPDAKNFHIELQAEGGGYTLP